MSYTNPSWPPRRVVPLPAWTVAHPWVRQPNQVAPTPAPQPAPLGALYPGVDANHSPVKFDLRKEPRKASRDAFMQHCNYSILGQCVRTLRLVCKDFPWPIEIENEWVTCGVVWQSVYAALQHPITESEWAMASEKQRDKIKRAVRHREAESGNNDMKPKRIDWLGDVTVFAGLVRDDTFVKQVTMPGRKDTVDTWVVRLSARRP